MHIDRFINTLYQFVKVQFTVFCCRDVKDGREKPNNHNIKLPPLKKTGKPDKRYEELMEAQKSDRQTQRRQVRLPKM